MLNGSQQLGGISKVKYKLPINDLNHIYIYIYNNVIYAKYYKVFPLMLMGFGLHSTMMVFIPQRKLPKYFSCVL